jgi:GTP-binding protein YchF
MKVGIVGLTGSGKTTVFDALSGASAPVATYGGPAGKSHLASVAIPDGRLTKLGELLSPQKVTPAHLDFEDFPGVPLGPGEDRQGGRVLLAHIREVDLLLIVLRSFANAQVPHPFGTNDAARDMAELEAEFLVSDQEMVEHRLESLRKAVRKHGKELEEHRRDLELMERCIQAFSREEALRGLPLTPAERPLVRAFGFLTAKPRVLLFNIGEEQAGEPVPTLSASGEPVSMCAEVEMEVGQLPEAERPAYLEALGIPEPAAPAVIQACHRALGLITFFTVAGPEVRAWSLPEGSHVIDAAGTIHSDMARGFIRADVVTFSDMAVQGSLQEAKAHGKMRAEGKDFVVKDGDILYIHFSV